ncbi:MAG: hypothetical protein M3O70_03215 [Actinomycetota bacterium]|nr:hypothetical protein [Actinomycetota bacterium]
MSSVSSENVFATVAVQIGHDRAPPHAIAPLVAKPGEVFLPEQIQSRGRRKIAFAVVRHDHEFPGRPIGLLRPLTCDGHIDISVPVEIAGRHSDPEQLGLANHRLLGRQLEHRLRRRRPLRRIAAQRHHRNEPPDESR